MLRGFVKVLKLFQGKRNSMVRYRRILSIYYWWITIIVTRFFLSYLTAFRVSSWNTKNFPEYEEMSRKRPEEEPFQSLLHASAKGWCPCCNPWKADSQTDLRHWSLLSSWRWLSSASDLAVLSNPEQCRLQDAQSVIRMAWFFRSAHFGTKHRSYEES